MHWALFYGNIDTRTSLIRSKVRLVKHFTIIRNGKIQHWLLHKEYSSSVAERLLTTPNRKNRAVSTENALESALLPQPGNVPTPPKTHTASNPPRTPPPIDELKEFEDDMLRMIQSTKFKQVNNHFLNTLKNDAESITNETKLIIAADKTTNFYKLDPPTYNNLLEQNITKSYKKAHPDTTRAIHAENKKIATKLGIDDRVDATANKDAFLTLKDHKQNFANKPTCRPINPTKSEIGRISKEILDRINSKITRASKFNQWKNTASVIEWFKAIENKQHHSFICFDIVEFYPSISQDLLDRALDFASAYDNITDDERNIIIHAKNSILIHKQQSWQKKGDTAFDVTMGSFDGAETCGLVGNFLLSGATKPWRRHRTLPRQQFSHF